jgi:GntR family transcriptional repressor for pyruvate dehydrogenase complex
MERVLDGTLPPGARLPAERTLAEQFGVSRTVIREAMRALVTRGLLETRGGSGTYVSDHDPTSAAGAMSPLSRMQQNAAPMPYVMVHEVRVVLETEAAGLAARRAERQDVAAMEREIAVLRQAAADTDGAAASTADAAFHLALATATHNEMFPVLAQLIASAMAQVRDSGFAVPGAYHNALAHHERILAAVQSHDAPSAIRSMRAHLGDAQTILLQGMKMASGEGERR